MTSLKEKIAKVIPENLFFLDLVEHKTQSRIKIIIDGLIKNPKLIICHLERRERS